MARDALYYIQKRAYGVRMPTTHLMCPCGREASGSKTFYFVPGFLMCLCISSAIFLLFPKINH